MTPDDALLPPLCLSGSKGCASFQATALQLKRDKQHYVAQPATFKDVVYAGTRVGFAEVRLKGTQNRVDVVDSGGKVILTDDREPLDVLFQLKWADAGWRLAETKNVVVK